MELGEVISKRERGEIKFSGRTTPKKGIISVSLGVLSLATILAMIILSAAAGGQGDWYLGVGGLLSLAMAVAGFVLAVRCFKMDDIYYGTPTGGAILNGVLMLGELALYVVGII